MYCVPPLKGFPLELSTNARGQKTSAGAIGPRKKFDDTFIRLDTIHQCDGQSDRQMDTGRQQKLHLRIASRGKNGEFCVAVGSATRTLDYTPVVHRMSKNRSAQAKITVCLVCPSSHYGVDKILSVYTCKTPVYVYNTVKLHTQHSCGLMMEQT